MKKILILIILILNMHLYATVTDDVVSKLEEATQKDTSKERINLLNFAAKDYDITTEFIKYNYVPLQQEGDSETDYFPANNQLSGYINANNLKILFFNKDFAYADYQIFEQIVCLKENKVDLILLYSQTDYSYKFGEITYSPYIYEIKKNGNEYSIKDVSAENKNLLNINDEHNVISFNLSDSTPRYPYYNKEKLIERLIDTGFCKKDEIIEGKIVNNIESKINLLNLNDLIIKLKTKTITIDKYYIVNLFTKYPLTTKTVTQYNDIAYYLQQSGANDEAIFLLKQILARYYERVVAHYNLGDAYWGLGEKEKAIASYNTYIQQMKANGKEKRIPQVVLDRIKYKESL